MEKKNIDWAGLGFEYIQTDKRFVANYKNGVWEEGGLTEEAAVIINECAGVLQYSQSCFEGLKAYTDSVWRIPAGGWKCRCCRKRNLWML